MPGAGYTHRHGQTPPHHWPDLPPGSGVFSAPGLECRECEVICERVVSPQHCLDSGCSSVYVYEDDDTKMFGCLHKVFAAELDLAAFARRAAGSGVPTPRGL